MFCAGSDSTITIFVMKKRVSLASQKADCVRSHLPILVSFLRGIPRVAQRTPVTKKHSVTGRPLWRLSF